MTKCEACTSCGMPFRERTDYALGDESQPYCKNCTRQDGTLRSYDEVLALTARYFIDSQGVDPQVAERMAKDLLSTLPAWSK